MKALMGILSKETLVGVTCWDLKSRLFNALVNFTFTYGIEIWGGYPKNCPWKFFEKGMKIHMRSHIKVRSLTTYNRPILELHTCNWRRHGLKIH